MTYELDFTRHKFAVIGLGQTGISIINYLKHKQAQIVRVFDTRLDPPHQDLISDIPLSLGELQVSRFNDIDVIVLSPGISIYEPTLQRCIAQGKLVVGDIELFAQAIRGWKSQIIGITGSNGKTTVTSLTGYLAQSCGIKTLIAGNIGTPVLNSYLEIITTNDEPELVVLELSSFQLESTYSLNLAAGTVLNISEDHLDRYRDLLEYAYVKAKIFNHCQTQVLNRNDSLVASMARPGKAITWFGESETCQFRLMQQGSLSQLQIAQANFIDGNELKLVGRHNYLNCLASLALLQAVGVEITQPKLKESLKQFAGLEHRMQKVTIDKGILYIEDSKGTNVGAVVAGVSGLDMPVHLIIGGDGKGQDFSPLRQLVAAKCKSVAIIGRDQLAMAQVLSGLTIPIQCCASLEAAVKFCLINALSGDAVVLSPACASWDMFKDYKHRAKVFIESIYANIS